MKLLQGLFCLVILASCSVHKKVTDLSAVKWIHGAAECASNKDVDIQIVRYDATTWILRQNKCSHYEAPFLFLLLGKDRAILMDSGASGDEKLFPLYETVRKLIATQTKASDQLLPLILAHTHNHSDHKAGDKQFENKPGITVVGVEVADVQSFFQLTNWPLQNGQIDLGDRKIDIIPIPGHEKASIALYDHNTKILLTGDSFYSGRLYINDWLSYQESISRLTLFAQKHQVKYILGNHIEMTSQPGVDYPVGTKFQPDEPGLVLYVKDLELLHSSLQKLGANPARKIHDRFIIYPSK
ncbi:MAG: MBL fold metallo-hydrolase [Chitinophagaceae bacterium]